VKNRTLFALLAGWFLASASSAQTGPNPTAAGRPPATAAGDPEVFLDPFTVTATQEVGYVPTAFLSGSRVGLALDETPYTINIVTRELLDDLGITDYNGATALFSGVLPQSETEIGSSFNDYQVSMRNIGTAGSGTPPTRNYFQLPFNFDAYNLDRMELVRGPNSFLNDNNDWGSFNSATKQAIKRPVTQFSLLASSFGGGRATVDLNRLLTAKWAVRLNLMFDDQKGWREIERVRKRGLHVTTSYQLTPQTLLRAEYEYADRDRWVPHVLGDLYSQWDGVTVVDRPLTANLAAASGLSRITVDEWVYNPAVGANQFMNFRNYAVSNGSTRGLLGADSYREYVPATLDGWVPEVAPGAVSRFGALALAPSRRTNTMQGAWPANNPANVGSVFLTHRFNPRLTFEFAAAYLRQQRRNYFSGNAFWDVRVDVVRTLPNGQANPYFGQLYVQGRTEYVFQENRNYFGRAQFAWADQLPWLKYRFLAGTNYQNLSYVNNTTRWMMDSGTNVFSNANNNQFLLRPRIYFNERFGPLPLPEGSPAPGLQVRPVRTAVGNPYSNTRYNHQLSFSGSWFRSGRLKTMAALRFDERYRENFDTWAADARGEFIVPRKVAGTRVPDKYATSRNAGISVLLVKGVHAYTSYSENTPSTATSVFDLNGNQLDDGVRRGFEAGLKGTLWDQRVGFSLNYFVNQDTNVSTTELASGADDFDARLEGILTRLGRPADLPDSFADTRTLEVKGWEFEATANLSRAVSLRADISISDTAVSDEFPRTRAYLVANRSAWTTAANSLAPQDRDFVLSQLAQIDQRVASRGPGRRLANTYKYTGSLAATYRLTTGPLKGTSATLAAILRGRRYVTTYPEGFVFPDGRVATPYDYVTQAPYEILRLSVSHARKLFGYQTRFQANLENLTDDIRLIWSTNNFAQVDATGRPNTAGRYYVPNRFTYTTPRRLTVSTSVQF
jgi:hypothetical protein